VIKKEEDRSADGVADLVAWFSNGQIERLEQDTAGKGCPDLRQWFNGDGAVRAEYRDTTGNCKTDVWSYFEKTTLVRQGLDSQGSGRPDVFNHLGEDGAVRIQEVASGDNGRNPDKKLFLDPAGQVTSQCLLDEKKAKLNTRAVVSGGIVTEILIDTTGDRWADTRQAASSTSVSRDRRRSQSPRARPSMRSPSRRSTAAASIASGGSASPSPDSSRPDARSRIGAAA
jgi:hypothetical protein